MTKTSTAAMDTHIAQDVTTLATAAVITRIDGQKFHVTTASDDVLIDIEDGNGVQTYSASEGVARTNIANDSELNVDNLDILGVFDSTVLKELDLRRGLFDFADFKLFVFNHQDTSTTMGIVKMFRGEFGEVIVTKQGMFKVTVRSLVQVYTKETGEHYSKDCRADVGDIRCKVPILPIATPRATSISVGDFFIASSQLEGIAATTLAVHGDNTAEDTSINGATPTLGSQASISSVTTKFGPESIEFTPSGSVDPSNSFVSYPDLAAYTIGTGEFTIELYARFKDLTSSLQIFASHYLNTGNERSWFFYRDSGDLTFSYSLNGVSTAPVTGAFTWAIDTWYHVAVTRDSSGDLRVFVDGTQVGSTVNDTGSIFNSATSFRLGKFRSTGFDDNPLDGFIEDFRFTNGFAKYTASFTPPGRFTNPLGVLPDLDWDQFDDRIYEVTTAGVTLAAQPAYDTVINNTTTDGSAVLTARHSWMRAAIVTAVDGSNPRRTFTVTELTPNSGHTTGSGPFPSALGFPDDFFNGGACFFFTGDNTGIAKEVRDFIADDGVTITQDIELFTDLPFDIQVGDDLRVFPGCDKTNPICLSKFNNGINFVGEPFVPGEDILGQYPDARQS